jgi:hypothetical protein
MIPKKALLVCLPIALGGGAVMVRSTAVIRDLESKLLQIEATGREEGDSFVRTLQGLHAERQLKAFDERRLLAVRLTSARRDRFLGLFAVAAAGLGLATAAVLRRIATEIEEDRRIVDSSKP